MSYSATQMAKKLDISRSYLYYLKDNGVIELEVNEKGRPMWTESVYHQIKDYIKKIMLLRSRKLLNCHTRQQKLTIVVIWVISINFCHL